MAHLPSGSFTANSAWLVLAAMAFNLTRAVGALAGRFHAKAVTATIRTQLITVAARVAGGGPIAAVNSRCQAVAQGQRVGSRRVARRAERRIIALAAA